MKILHIIPSLNIGGAENLLIESTKFYAKKNIDLEILVLKKTDSLLYKKVREEGSIKISYLSTKSYYNPLFCLKIRKLLNKYDIIHVHLFPALYFVAIATLFNKGGAKLIYTEHSTFNKRRKFSFLKPLEKFIYNQYSKIITISKDVDDALKQYIPINTTLIENGIDTKKYRNAEGYPRTFFFKEESTKILMQVSSFRYPKDHKTIIRALLSLPKNVKLILIGDGPLKKETEEYSIEKGFNKRVLFLGLRTDIPQLLKSADILILSTAYEGLSLASLEAMATQKPFIASNVPGLKDIVEGAGLLFPYQDEVTLANQITHLLSDQKYYDKIANACYIRSQEYDIRIMVDKYIAIYNDIMNNHA